MKQILVLVLASVFASDERVNFFLPTRPLWAGLVRESPCPSVRMSGCQDVPFPCHFFCVEELVWSPSYYTRGAHLITRVEPILLHAWSPKNGKWVQSVHRPRVEPSRGRVDTSTASFFFFNFFYKSCNLSKFVLDLRSASVERVDAAQL